MGQNVATSIRVTITIEQSVYEKIKRISRQLGLKPAAWITMVTTAKVNNLDVTVNCVGKGGNGN